jgi:hypothetical protein
MRRFYIRIVFVPDGLLSPLVGENEEHIRSCFHRSLLPCGAAKDASDGPSGAQGRRCFQKVSARQVRRVVVIAARHVWRDPILEKPTLNAQTRTQRIGHFPSLFYGFGKGMEEKRKRTWRNRMTPQNADL